MISLNKTSAIPSGKYSKTSFVIIGLFSLILLDESIFFVNSILNSYVFISQYFPAIYGDPSTIHIYTSIVQSDILILLIPGISSLVIYLIFLFHNAKKLLNVLLFLQLFFL